MKVIVHTAVSFGDGHWYPVAKIGPARVKKPTNWGYSQLHNPDGSKESAHRHFYEAIIGRIPKGLDLDHLCRIRSCCAPTCMEPVTRRVNLHRGLRGPNQVTHCPQGHAYSPANTHVNASGHRTCRTCGNERAKAKYRDPGVRARILAKLRGRPISEARRIKKNATARARYNAMREAAHADSAG